MRRSPAVIIPLAMGALVAACGETTSPAGTPTPTSKAAACVGGSISASGSTALQPLVQAAADAYHATCPAATVSVSGGGSSAGLANVAAGTSDIGNSDVPVSNAKNLEASTLADHQVAIVVFAIGVNPQTGVTNLTTSQARDIFSGNVSNWSQVGGANLPVTLIERKAGSGTRLAFDQIIMKDVKESSTPASTQDSTQLVLQGIAGSPGGVSYLNAGSISASSGVTAVTLDGATPDTEAVKQGRYPYYSHEHMYTKAGAGGLVSSFIDFILSPEFQKGRVKDLKYLPVSVTSRQSAAD